MDQPRVSYELAGRAARASTEAALAGNLSPTDLRVLVAVHALTVSWSRLADRVSLGQLVKAAGVPTGKSDRDAEKRVARSLSHLAVLGAVYYRPGGGRGRAGTVGVPIPKGGQTDPPLGDKRGSVSDRKGGLCDAEKGVRADPVPEKYPEKPFPRRSRGGSAFGDGSAWADHPGGLVEL